MSRGASGRVLSSYSWRVLRRGVGQSSGGEILLNERITIGRHDGRGEGAGAVNERLSWRRVVWCDDVEDKGGCARSWETGQLRGGRWRESAGEAKRRGCVGNERQGRAISEMSHCTQPSELLCRHRDALKFGECLRRAVVCRGSLTVDARGSEQRSMHGGRI